VLLLVIGMLVAIIAIGCGENVGSGGPAGAQDDPTSRQEALTAPAWAPGRSYAVGALVTFNGIVYECRQAHRSQAGQEPPKVYALWQRPTPSGVAEWTVQTHYVVGSVVTFKGTVRDCLQEHVSQPDWPPDLTPALWRCASLSCGGGGCAGVREGGPCDDGSGCTLGDACKSGKCVGAPKVCPGATACLDATCNKTSGQCGLKAKPAGTSCSDGNVCNGAELCDAKGTCTAGTPPNCDDGNTCTADSCDPAAGCKSVPSPGATCNDGDACTETDVCDGAGVCKGSGDVCHAAFKVKPLAECVIDLGNGSFKAVFGYRVTDSSVPVTRPIGDVNRFLPGNANRGQPTTFQPGFHHAQFAVDFDGKALEWDVDGDIANATALLPRCNDACVAHLTSPGTPPTTGVLSQAAPLLSQAESNVVRDAFSWDDTVSVPEKGTDGIPLLYYGMVYVDSKSALDALEGLQIHYDRLPMFREEMDQFEAAADKFYYDFDGQGQFVFALVPGVVYNALRAAALDPNEPGEIFRAFQVRPLPVAEAKSTCDLKPVAECVGTLDNQLVGVFGYDNPSDGNVTVPIGPDNPKTAPHQPEVFAPGVHHAAFAVPMGILPIASWTLNGKSATATFLFTRSCTPDELANVGKERFEPPNVDADPTACRLSTPAESALPDSQLPPASRANTCVSLKYEYAGKLGFKWRGLDPGQTDEAAEAVLADLAAADSPVAAPGRTGTQPKFFGKIFRKVFKKVVSVVQTAVDGVRQGITLVAGVFVGFHEVKLDLDVMNTDPFFNASAGSPSKLVRTWGTKAGDEIVTPGVSVRAVAGLFLDKTTADANNHATVRALDGIGGTVCLQMKNGPVELVDGLFMAPIICSFAPDATGKTHRVGLPTSATAATISVPVMDGYMNTLAQLTDGAQYMRNVANFNMHRVEVVVGVPANAIGFFNGNRAFTPCFGFSWANDVSNFTTALGAVLADKAGDRLIDGANVAAQAAGRATDSALAFQRQAIQSLLSNATLFDGTPLEAPFHELVAAEQAALAAAEQMRTDVLKSSGAVEGATQAIQLVQRLEADASARAQAVRTQAENDIAEIEPLATAAKLSGQSAEGASTAALAKAEQFVSLAVGDSLKENFASEIRALTGLAHGQVGLVIEAQIRVAAQGVAMALRGVGMLVGSFIGDTVGQVFQLFAGGDMVMPVKGSDFSDRRSIRSRAVPSHEYGHFTLCNLLADVSTPQFVIAYNEAAADGILGQTADKPHVVINEAFADYIAGQLAGGADYSPLSGAIAPCDTGVSAFASSDTYCPLNAPADCFDGNFVARSSSFNDKVAEVATLVHDFFDGWKQAPFGGDLPSNANVWKSAGAPMCGVDSMGNPIGNAARVEFAGQSFASDDDAVMINELHRVVFEMLSRGDRLRYTNFFRGLSETAAPHANWCARCEVFKLHSSATPPTCPDEFVGPRPNGLVCEDEPCPPPSTIDHARRICVPPCPPGTTFDPISVSCKPIIP
jgi:hypothetical protein